MCRARSVTLFLAAFLLQPQISSANSMYSGTVVANNQPVDGAKVWLRSYTRTAESKDVLVETQADVKGRFTLTKPKDTDAIPSEIIARAADGRIGWLSLFRNDSAESADLRIELFPVGEARGRLTDSAGRPLLDVHLRVRSLGIREGKATSQENWHQVPDSLTSLFEATTGADGSFVLRGIPLGSGLQASVSAPRYGSPDVFWKQDQTGDFRLERAGRVRLHFTGAANPRQLAGLPLELFTYPKSNVEDGRPLTNAGKSIKTKDQDTLDIADVLPGRCNLRFFGAGKVPYVPKQLPEFTVKPGELTEVTIPLEPAAHVHGRVINGKNKKGVGGLQLSLESESGDNERRRQPGGWVWLTTDAEGRFSAYIRAGRIGVRITDLPDGYASSTLTRELVKPVKVTAGAEHTFPDIILEPAVHVEGIVVDESGKPVPGVQVRNSEDDFGWSRRGRTVTDAEGKFVLRGLGVEDVFALRARSDRGVTDGGIVVNVAEQRGPVRLVLSEKAACRLTGRVVDNLGRPVAAAAVGINWNYRGVGRHANMGIGTGLGGVKTDAEGRFQSGVLWPGDTYQVNVTDEGHGRAESIRVTGKAGQVHDLGTILLPRTSAELRGVVVEESGHPVAGVNVFNRADAPQPVSTVTDKAGRFHLSGLFDGPVLVLARKEGYRFTMTRAETGTAEARVVLLKAGSVPPAAPESQSKTRRDAEQKLLRHLLDKVLNLSEAATGGYRRHVFECLARTDLAKAEKWLDKEKAAGGSLGANDVRRYLHTLRKIQAEQAAASDVDEAISLLSEVDAEDACDTLRKLGERFQATEQDRGLRFAEEAVVKARGLPLPNRVWELAAAADLVIRLGKQQAGRKLLNEAADLAEKLGTQGLQQYARASAARRLAPYDLSRARQLLRPIGDTPSVNEWLSEMAGHLARTDPKAALSLVDELKEDRSTVREVTRLRIARQAAVRGPAVGARIAASIPDVRYRAEALVQVATAVAGRDRKLAWSLIDQALALYLDQPEPFRSWTNCGGRAVFAAWTAGQAQVLGYPDPASAVARALACQLDKHEAHSPAHALETQVRMAKVLALVDPSSARHLLDRVAPQQNVLGTGYSGFEKQDWLLARCLADPERGPALVDEAIAKLDAKDRMSFYNSGLMQLAQVLSAPPEQRVRKVMGLNSGLVFPNEE
ncbi:MAG TPA: carboxypeptidase-like regulatory domain-containing protein [Gemmataceae bacterium]|nr:carboxypeptidase-like regulatory domain-containing protein [Gemmataceae bacterium]